jgi:hypothetical protein
MSNLVKTVSPSDVAMALVRRPRFAFFTDDRGVVYCEQVDHTKVVMSCLGHTQGGQSTVYRHVLQYNGDETKFNAEGRSKLESGFTIEQNMAYMLPNMWGAVKVIKETSDLAAGKKLRKILRAATPEGFYDNDPDLLGEVHAQTPLRNRRPVQPFTSMVLSRLVNGEGWSTDYYLEQYGAQMTADEKDYFLRHNPMRA